MKTLNRVLSAALLSATLVAGSAGLAQAGSFNSISDIQPSTGRAEAPLVAHRVLATTNTVSGMAVVYSAEELPVASIGPRDVSEGALDAESYVGGKTVEAAPQLAQR
jgi:hypothetical protein